MKDFTAQYRSRSFDVLFYANPVAMTVDRVQAFVCSPTEDHARWVPELGLSASIGHGIYRTEGVAERMLIKALVSKRRTLKARLKRIDTFLQGKGR
jgi:hypothetical protein